MVMKRLYIDVETTGLNAQKNGIHEIAGYIEANGETVPFSYKLRPPDFVEFSVPENNPHLEPVTAEDVKDYPPHEEVYREFVNLLSRYVDKYDTADKFYVVGYNIAFDIDFLRQWFIWNGDQYFGSWVWFPPIDVMILASTALMGQRHLLPNFRLGTVYKHLFNEELVGAHNAYADITATKRILGEVFARLTSYGKK